MDELRGPRIQIVLHVREGLGFGFLKNPFFVSGSLNSYLLETDPVLPSHAPIFDSELVWEADKRRFRNLRVQNVPVKVEVYITGSQSRKDKVGYLLLSLLAAQPCPANKYVNVKNTWHKLLGVRSDGKCCHPQLLLSLTVEDRTSIPTPRNELRMFHSNEVAYLSSRPETNPGTLHTLLQTYDDYIMESQKTVSSPELKPKLICEEGIIEIGDNPKHLFVLSFVIGSAENVDLLLPTLQDNNQKESVDCFITYSVFSHNITTDRVPTSVNGEYKCIAQFNQRTSLRLSTDLASLTKYFSECPYVVTKFCTAETDVGISSMDLGKLVPTDDINNFVQSFCNMDKSLNIHERCYILCSKEQKRRQDDNRKCYIDIEMSLKYVGLRQPAEEKLKPRLTTRSASQLPNDNKGCELVQKELIDFKSGSCVELNHDGRTDGVAYTNITASNTTRYNNAVGNVSIQSEEIADIIKKMCESFTLSQEKLLAARAHPMTSDMQVQCEPIDDVIPHDAPVVIDEKVTTQRNCKDSDPKKLETYETSINNCVKEKVKETVSESERDGILRKFMEELEDWKEKQQQLFKYQLKQKEEYHLNLLSKEWMKRRMELECKLSKGIEQCRNLASDLSRATEDFRMRGFRNTERERKLLDAKKALELHYTGKYQELREASQKMEDDMKHQIKLKDMKVEELETTVQHLQKKNEVLQNNIKNIESDSANKYSGLTKDQTASLIQELRCLEEKLDSAIQSKAFFKEQWGRAVRELHFVKLNNRKQMLTQLQQDRKEIGDIGLDTILDQKETKLDRTDLNKLKDDFYVDILANTPTALDPMMSDVTGVSGGIDGFSDLKSTPKNSMSDRLNDLFKQRDQLIQEDNPNENLMKQLNQEIRNILLNSGA